MPTPLTPLTTSPEWHALQGHQRAIANTRIAQWFVTDKDRYKKFSLELDGLLVDFSRHFLSDETLPLLTALAQARGLPAWIERMFNGEPINHTEDRAVLHAVLRETVARGVTDRYYEDLYDDVIRRGVTLRARSLQGAPWTEVDDHADLARARALVRGGL